MSQNQSQLKVWAKSFTSNPDDGGKTKGTFDLLGTIKIPNKSENLYLLGFLGALVGRTVTAGESGAPIIRINSSDVGLINEDFPLSELGFCDPISTNSQKVAVSTVFIPVEVNLPVNNKSFDIYVSSLHQTMTADWVGYFSAVFCNQPIDSLPVDFLMECMNDFECSVRALGRYAADSATAIGTAHVDVSLSNITVPAKAKTLVGLLADIMPNADTAAEEIACLMTFNAGDISDFAPQEWPCCVAYNAPLGTVVGGAVNHPARFYPIRFPLPGTEFSFSAKIRNVLAITNAPNLAQGIKFLTYEKR